MTAYICKCGQRVQKSGSADNTGILESIASALGKALAALEILSTLSDAFQREYLSSVKFSHDTYYDELEKLRIKHGYTKESNA